VRSHILFVLFFETRTFSGAVCVGWCTQIARNLRDSPSARRMGTGERDFDQVIPVVVERDSAPPRLRPSFGHHCGWLEHRG